MFVNVRKRKIAIYNSVMLFPSALCVLLSNLPKVYPIHLILSLVTVFNHRLKTTYRNHKSLNERDTVLNFPEIGFQNLWIIQNGLDEPFSSYLFIISISDLSFTKESSINFFSRSYLYSCQIVCIQIICVCVDLYVMHYNQWIYTFHDMLKVLHPFRASFKIF